MPKCLQSVDATKKKRELRKNYSEGITISSIGKIQDQKFKTTKTKANSRIAANSNKGCWTGNQVELAVVVVAEIKATHTSIYIRTRILTQLYREGISVH